MLTVAQEEDLPGDLEEQERLEWISRMPPLSHCYNLLDFEAVARRVMKKTAWAYYSSGADDEIVCTCPAMNERGKSGSGSVIILDLSIPTSGLCAERERGGERTETEKMREECSLTLDPCPHLSRPCGRIILHSIKSGSDHASW